jgi:hypothetical protein
MAPRSLPASTRHPSEQRTGDDQGKILDRLRVPPPSPSLDRITAVVVYRARDSAGISRSQAVRAPVSIIGD